jgi:predicted AAA+ superfamily ATPase
VRRLYDKENCEIFISGSSAKLLSYEIATELRGRTWDYDIYPLSFLEYLCSQGFEFKNEHLHSKERFEIIRYFEKYLIEGGFPEVYGYNEYIRCRILQTYFEVMIVRDIMERHSFPYIDIVKDMLLYLANNFGRPFSIHKYYNIVKTQNKKVSKDTLYTLSEYAQETMYFYFVPIYSNSKAVQMVNPKKVYLIDNGLANCLSMKATKDLSWYYENLVFIELLRRGFSMYYHRGNNECDFIAVDGNKKQVIQVTLDGSKEEELAGLMEGMAAAKVNDGILITKDEDRTFEKDGKNIRCVPLWKWLLL